MAKTIYMSTQCSFMQMPLHINGHFVDSTFLFLFLFSAIADLLDNAVDEIQNGATFVIVDKTSIPRDGSPALLIQDKKMLKSSLSFIMDQMHDELLKLEG
ncbi:unnamed protein product [Prunus armeniaca]|uniref:Uncharacterized protein n=1 Tax=Prunus armeniaca TaxID=36596 RepID=A0A6J5WAK8_PRUAR|nr:unnamed protein product [Prunus armeniaca]